MITDSGSSASPPGPALSGDDALHGRASRLTGYIFNNKYILLVPAVTLMVLLFGGGLVVAFIQSVTEPVSVGGAGIVRDCCGESRFGGRFFSSYRYLMHDVGFYRSFALTLGISLVTTVVSVVTGIAMGLVIRGNQRSRWLVRLANQLPITVPHVIAAIAVFLLFTQSGLLSRLLYAVGIIDSSQQFPALVSDRFGVGIVIAYLWKEIPFITLIALSSLQSIGEDYEIVARTLGARPLTILRRVTLPLISPTVVPATIIVFAFVFGSYEVPVLLGRSYPSMLAVLSYRYYSSPNLELRPVAMALNILITLFVLLVGVIFMKISQNTRRAVR